MAAAHKDTPSDAFAVIATGGKQYKVAVGDTVTIEKLSGADGSDLKKGDTITFDQVLLTDSGTATIIGTPVIAGATVTAEVASVFRAPKVMVIKYKQKSRYMKKNGHRQPLLKVKILSI